MFKDANLNSTTRPQIGLFGVNLAGAEFGELAPTNSVGTSHTYPSWSELELYADKGFDVIRLPFRWARLQPELGGPLDSTELGFIDATVAAARALGLAVVLNPHDFGMRDGQLIGGVDVPTAAFADFWGRLAGHFADSPNVIFALMNEPHLQTASEWLPVANAAVAAIRAAGATQEILVPGTYWDGAWTWTSTDNAAVLGAGVADPLDNFAFDLHQYLDADGSGTHLGVASASLGAERLADVTAWAEQTGNRLFLSEFGVASDSTSLAALDNMLRFMAEHPAVWQGATYWAAGAWWGDHPFAVTPVNGVDRPQMDVLEKYVSPDLVPYWGPEPVVPAVPGTLPVAARVLGRGSDALVISLSQDAFEGNARFLLRVDGEVVGGALEATALRSAGQRETVELRGDWAPGRHQVSVEFLNDHWGNTADTDRNLYVEGATFNGASLAGSTLDLLSSGAGTFGFQDATALPGTHNDFALA